MDTEFHALAAMCPPYEAAHALQRFGREMRRTCLAAAVLVIATTSFVAADETREPLLDADQIAQRIGSETDAKDVFSIVFAHLRLNDHDPFLRSQIRPEWLPEGDDATSTLLGDVEAQGTLINCGTYWVVSDVRRSGNVVTMRLKSRCGGSVLEYTAHYDGRRWRFGPYDLPKGHGWSVGIGSGFVGGPPPGCPCVPQR